MKVAKLVRVSLVTRVVVEDTASEQDIMELAVPKLSENLMDSPFECIDEIVEDTECPYRGVEEITPLMVTITVFRKKYYVRNFFNFNTQSGLEVLNDDNMCVGSIIGEELPDLSDAESVDNFKQMFEVWIIENENKFG